jgi:hypothetical protein
MTNKELAQFLTDNEINTLEIEDTEGNTVLYIDLKDYSVADVDNKIIRIQREFK